MPSKPVGDYRVLIGGQVVDLLESPPAPRRRARPRDRDAVAVEPEPDPADTRLVQFTSDLTAGDMDRIRRDYGLALTAYVPNLTYVERVDAGTERRLLADPMVRAVAPYLAEYKIAPSIGDANRPLPAGIVAGQHLLDAFLFDGGSTERVSQALQAAGAHDIVVLDDRPIGGNARVRFVVDDDSAVAAIAAVPDIRWIEPITPITDDNVAAASVIQSGQTASASIWGKGLHGEGQVIGIFDNGPLDINHCFFADAAPNTPGPGHRKVLALRNASGTAAGGHATFVSGCAAGDDRNNPGASAFRGGAWAAQLVSGNNNDLGAATLLAELNAAMGAGAFIHSNSWHDTTNGVGGAALYNQNAADVDNFTWTNENHLVVGSAGNSSPTPEELGPPGTAKNALCVTAAQSGNNPTTLGDGNSGPTADGRSKPDLAAVGCGIQSATVGTACGTGPRSACATSYATPHTAAAAALIRQYFTEGWYPTGEKVAANALTPTGNLLKAVLVASTVDLSGVAGYPNVSEGWGLIRLDRALFFKGGQRRLAVWDVRHATGPTSRDLRTHTFKVDSDTEQLKVVLTFSDPPPAAGAFASPTVNDLDLRVFAPDGTVYRGNDFTNGVSTVNSVFIGDPLNTIEVVLIDKPPAGQWTIEVSAFRVAVGNPGQGYAVAASARLKSGGCFVATAVYGDADHPDVEALRAWRDRNLEAGGVRGRAMRLLAAAYERAGPGLARGVQLAPPVQRVLRRALLPAAARLVREEASPWA